MADWVEPLVIAALAVGTWVFRTRPGGARIAAAALPTAALVALFVFASVSGSHPTHAELLLFVAGALVAATASWLGARLAFDHRRVVLGLYGLAVGLLWFGETIAVVLLNWG